jgi:hypothetical protein
MSDLTIREKLIIACGWLGIILNLLGIFANHQILNFCGILICRFSGGMYNSYINPTKSLSVAFYLPLGFGILSVVFNSATFTFLELATASICYQITAVSVFKKIRNK